jgi:demethoxyubiquinone hydroxylase (CLK1/Coq7/Cat5 family)
MTAKRTKKISKVSEKDALKSMSEIIQYMAPDEERHYEECIASGESGENHIFNHITKVGKYLIQKGVV